MLPWRKSDGRWKETICMQDRGTCEAFRGECPYAALLSGDRTAPGCPAGSWRSDRSTLRGALSIPIRPHTQGVMGMNHRAVAAITGTVLIAALLVTGAFQ